MHDVSAVTSTSMRPSIFSIFLISSQFLEKLISAGPYPHDHSFGHGGPGAIHDLFWGRRFRLLAGGGAGGSTFRFGGALGGSAFPGLRDLA